MNQMASFISPHIPPATAPPVSSISTSKSSTVASFYRFPLSRSERRFIEDGVLQSVRVDGRALLDFRPFTVEVGVLPSTNGSSRLRTADSELVVGVKCEVFSLKNSLESNQGKIECGIDCSSSLDVEMDRRTRQDISDYLARLIERLCLGPAVFDPRKLCVLPGHFAWKVHVDVVILNGGGNIVDAISLGIKAALLNTKLPSVQYRLEYDEETGEETFNIDVDPRPEMGEPLPVDDVPICVTVGQIQNRFVWDLSGQEDVCSSAGLIIAIDSNGKCRGVHKTGDSAMRLGSITAALQNSRVVGCQLHKNLVELISKSSAS